MVDFVNVVKRLCVIIDVFFVCLLGSGVFKQVFLIEKVGEYFVFKILVILDGL